MADFPLSGGQEEISAGFDLANVRGTQLTTGAANTKGAYVELLSAANNVSMSTGISVTLQQDAANTVTDQLLIDIAIGEAGSEVVVIPNLWYFTDNANVFQTDVACFPLMIPSGVRVSARAQGRLASTVIPVNISLLKSGFMQPSSFGEIVAIGADESTTSGVTVVRSSTPGQYGSWVEITASTVDEYSGFIISAHRAADGWANAALTYDVGIGSAGNEEVIMEKHYCTQSSSEIGHGGITCYKPLRIPKGSRVSIRAAGSVNNTDLDFDYVMYGVK